MIPNTKILTWYIFISLFTIVSWVIFGKCQVTSYTNELCNENKYKNKDKYFQDIIWALGLKKYDEWNNFLHYIYIIIGIMFAYYHIKLLQ